MILDERWFFNEEGPGICSQIPVVGVPGGIGSVGNAIETGGLTGGRGPGVATGSPGASNVGAGPGGGVAGYGAAAAARSGAQQQAAQVLSSQLTPGGQLVLAQLGLTPLTAVYNGLPASYFNNAATAASSPPPPPPQPVYPAAVYQPPVVAPVTAPTPLFSIAQPTPISAAQITPSPLEDIAHRIGQLSSELSKELPRVAGGLVGEFFGGPPGAFIGQQVGAYVGSKINPYIAPQIGPPPPPSYLAYQTQQAAPQSMAPISPQPAFNPVPIAPLVGQEYCPDCDPQNRFLRAQKEQVSRDIQREKSQLRSKAISQQQSQIQRLEEQERLPVEYQRSTDIQESLRQKQQLLAQIDQELQDLENQRYEQAGMQRTAPTAAQPTEPAPLAPLINGSEETQQPVTTTAQQPVHTSSSTGPTVICIGCESQYDALAFLNGEPSAKCAVIPPPGE